MTEHLQSEAGLNSLQDREYTGYIKAVKDMLLTQVEDITKETT